MEKRIKNINLSTWKIIVLIGLPLLSTLMHLRAFPMDLLGPHVWRQTQTVTNVVNFYETDFNILNPRRNNTSNGTNDETIYRLEFPVMQWLFAGIYKMFGNHLIISRILSFIISLLSVLGFYKILQGLFKKESIALIGAWALNFSPAFYYYAVSPLPDNFALCCGIWGVAVFLRNIPKVSWTTTIISAALLSLGVATKLPFILFYSIPFFFYIQKIIQQKLLKEDILKGIIWVILFLPALSWYLWVIPTWDGQDTTFGILKSDLSIYTVLDILRHNLLSTLPELILNLGAIPFFLFGIYYAFRQKFWKKSLTLPLLIWTVLTCLYFLFELNIIQKVHDYYLFPFYPILFIIVAYGAYHLSKIKYGKSIVAILLISLPIFALARIQGRWNVEEPRFNKDLLHHKTELREFSQKSDLVVVGNDESYAIWFYYLDRKGWVFAEDRLTPKRLESMITKGAKYLYTDSEAVLNNPEFQSYFQQEVGNFGTIHVFELKQ